MRFGMPRLAALMHLDHTQMIEMRDHVVDLIGVARASERCDPDSTIGECGATLCQWAVSVNDDGIVFFGQHLVRHARRPERRQIWIVGRIIARAATGSIGLPRTAIQRESPPGIWP